MNSVKNSKEDLARLFKQWASVSDLVVKGNRSAGEVSRVLQEIISSTSKPFVYAESASQYETRFIMKRNFLSIYEVGSFFGIMPTAQQTAVLKEVPFSKKVLQECKDTHVLVADFGLSILDIRNCVKDELFYSYEDAWCKSEQFASETSKPCWRLIRKGMVSRSISKTCPQEQQELLDEIREVSSAREMVYVIILNYLATGKRMFEDILVRTSTVASHGDHIVVGLFDCAGLRVFRSAG